MLCNSSLPIFKVSKNSFFGHFGLFLAYFQVPKIFKMCLNTIRVCNSSLPNIFLYFYTYIRHCHSSKSQIWLFLVYFGLFLVYFQVPKIFKMYLDTVMVCNSTLPNIFIHFYTYIRHSYSSKSQKWLFLPIFSLFSGA